MKHNVRLSILIVNWNTCELVLQCLRTIERMLKDQSVEVFVVDNNSADSSADRIEAEFSEVSVIRSAENLGFARGNNLGLLYARGSYIVLLNSDTIVEPSSIMRLVDYLDQNPEVGAAGGRHFNNDKRHVPSAFRFPSVWHELSIAVGLNWVLHLMLHKNLRIAKYWFPIQTQYVDWVSGSFVAVRRQVIDTVGPLPEEFFLYGEDVEWCWRMRRAGWRVSYVHEATIIHLENRSSAQLFKSDVPYRYLDAFYTFAIRHRNPIGWRIGWLACAAHWLAQSFRYEARLLFRRDREAGERARSMRRLAGYYIEQMLGVVKPIGR